MEILEGEAARVIQGGPLNRRFSLQGQPSQGRHRDRRRNSLAQVSHHSPSPTLVSRAAACRRFSDFGHPLATADEDSRSLCRVPTVVLTKESPPPHAEEEEAENDGDRVKTLFEPPYMHSNKENFFVLGNASKVTAVVMDYESADEEDSDETEDLLNNNAVATVTVTPMEDDMQSSSGSSMESSSVSTTPSSSSSGGSSSKRGSSCSLSTTTISQGELQVIRPCGDHDNKNMAGKTHTPFVVATTAFTTMNRDVVTVSRGNRNVVTKTSTSSTIFWNNNDNNNVSDSSGRNKNSSHYNSNLCPENPFRKVFAKRKEFYQSIADKEAKVSSVNRLLLRKRHCAVCCAESRSCQSNKEHTCSNAATQIDNLPEPVTPQPQEEVKEEANKKLTLDADISPFPPFTIRHDLSEANSGSEIAVADGLNGLIRSPSSSSDLARRLLLQQGSSAADGLTVDADGGLHYAASAINSEDGVESRLEVSVGADGSSVITTRHKRLGSPSEISNNSVVHVQVDEDGGKVVKIQHSQQKKTVATPPHLQNQKVDFGGGFLMPSASAGCLSGLLFSPALMMDLQRPSSAYCTQVSPGQDSPWTADQEVPQCPRYNSLPNMHGRRFPQPVMMCDSGPPLIEDFASTIQHQPQLHRGGQWEYNLHPADEEKRIAYTRGTQRREREMLLKTSVWFLHSND